MVHRVLCGFDTQLENFQSFSSGREDILGHPPMRTRYIHMQNRCKNVKGHMRNKGRGLWKKKLIGGVFGSCLIISKRYALAHQRCGVSYPLSINT